MAIADRILTIVVTATLTSAAWIVGGAGWIEAARDASMPGATSDVSGSATGDERPGATRSVEAETVAPAGELFMPVPGIPPEQLSDTFTQSRGGGERLHEAIDIMAARGTPVLAAAPGKVEKLFRSDAGGNTIYIRSADGRTVYYYAHLDRYAEDLREGGRVAAGDMIGTVGSTGNADPSGPHLHFAIFETTPDAGWWESARAINPYPLLRGN